ncbi:MAG: CBS domain-containing protein [Candidatus Saccharimonadales bacterium]
MVLLITILLILSVTGLFIVAGFRPVRSTMSQFELERRMKSGDKATAAIIRREHLLVDIISLQRLITALLLVLAVLLAVARFGWAIGVIVAVLLALEYGAVARLTFIQNQSQKIYEKYEQDLLRIVEKFPKIFTFLRSVPPNTSAEMRLESREELLHLVASSGTLLSSDEKQFIKHSLSFDDQLVESVMTPRSVIDSVSHTELLGPLALDDLHKTGHSRFPVTSQDIDHIIGMLHVHDLLSLTNKKSVTAEMAMEQRVYYIKSDQTLGHALAAFLRTHHHLFVVVNEFRETVGLLSLEDVIEAMIGHKIIDEFDAHDDLRIVAARNPRGNNHPDTREDV